MNQSKSKCLAVSFAAVEADGATPVDLDVGTVVEIAADLTVKAINSLAPTNIVGAVAANNAGSNRVTVNTRFRERRDDRTSAVCTLGAFVYDSDGTVISRTAGIRGSKTGTALGPFLPVTGATDTLKIKMEGEASETFVLAPTDTTNTLVAAKINATAVKIRAYLNVTGHLVLEANEIDHDLIIETVTHDDYTELGFIASTGAGAAASHDFGAVAGVVIKLPDVCSVIGWMPAPFTIANGASDAFKVNVGGTGAQTFDLTTGANDAQDICDKINATATGFTAEVAAGLYVKLVADDPWKAIEIVTVALNAYEILGFGLGTTAAPTAIETLEK